MADHGGLGHLRVRHDRRLDLRRREQVSGHVHHVVDPADHPDVAVLVLARGVADEVAGLVPLREVGLLEALRVPEQRAEHPRPGSLERQQALLALPTSLPSSSSTVAAMPGSGLVAEPGLAGVKPGSGEIMMWPVSVCHQVSTIGQRSPPITFQYQSQALGLIGSPTVPEQAQLREVVLVGLLDPPLHARADGGRRRVEERDPVALAELPPDVLGRVVGRALVHHRGHPVHQRAVDDVGVAGDPADVGGAPAHVLVGLHVEHVLRGPGDTR